MEQEWRVYSPKGKDTKYDTKMTLRNMMSMSVVWPTDLGPVGIDDYGDDYYEMCIRGEEVSVVAREEGQRTITEGVFDDVYCGIFYRVSEENCREAESAIVKTFR
jgi:hypothetical protein